MCYNCGRGDDEHVLLICDRCDFYCCHIYCDPELTNHIPEGDWYCRYCQPALNTLPPLDLTLTLSSIDSDHSTDHNSQPNSD